MRATITKIVVTDLILGHAREVLRIAQDDEPEALRSADCDYPPIVRRVESGYVVVDGFHRLAGMVAAEETSLKVVVVTDADDLCARIDCDSSLDAPEIASIYAAAGL